MPIDELARAWFQLVGRHRAVGLSEYAASRRLGFGSGLAVDSMFGIAVIIAWMPIAASSIQVGDMVAYAECERTGEDHYRIVGEPVRLQSVFADRS